MRRSLTFLAVGFVAGVLVLGTTGALATHRFPDVRHDAFYSDAVEWALDHDITTGYGNTGEFRPDAPTTRGQMVTFLQRLHDAIEGDELWARVDDDGSLLASSGAVSGVRTAEGTYRVTFDRDVTACRWQATAVGPTPNSLPHGYVQLGRLNGKPRVVLAITIDPTSAKNDRGFHLTVSC